MRRDRETREAARLKERQKRGEKRRDGVTVWPYYLGAPGLAPTDWRLMRLRACVCVCVCAWVCVRV